MATIWILLTSAVFVADIMIIAIAMVCGSVALARLARLLLKKRD